MSLITETMDLEREYTPSAWSTRFPTPQQVFQHHLNFVTEASELATNTVPHKLEIEYGFTDGQKLDILGTDLPDDSPILVFVHGGYWQELSREVSRYPALSLHRAKVKVMVIGYDLCPNATLPEIVDQIRRAAKFIFEYAEKMDSRGVYFAGYSAGAHLVAKLLASADFLDSTPGSHRLQSAFLISGIYDLREMIQTSVNELVQLPEEWAKALSPQFDDFTHLKCRRVRLYILAAQNDSPTFKKQSREFYELLLDTCLTQDMYLEIKDEMDHFYWGVYFAGYSAGAHLVAKLLASADFLDSTPGSHRLQSAFLISGIYDLREMIQTSVNELVQLPEEWAKALSPQFDDFTHLKCRRVRLYILAAQNDSPTFKKQSREFYELLLDTCLTQDMYLEIKDEMDHFDIVECFAKENNYLRSLLVHDIRKHL